MQFHQLMAVDLGNSKTFNKIPSPSKPNTIYGLLLQTWRLLILISIKSVSLFFGANSSKYTAAAKAIGNEINKQINIVNNDPRIAPPKPASSGSRYHLLKINSC